MVPSVWFPLRVTRFTSKWRWNSLQEAINSKTHSEYTFTNWKWDICYTARVSYINGVYSSWVYGKEKYSDVYSPLFTTQAKMMTWLKQYMNSQGFSEKERIDNWFKKKISLHKNDIRQLEYNSIRFDNERRIENGEFDNEF